MTIIGLVTALGSSSIGSNGRMATLTLYYDNEEIGQIDMMLTDPQIGDQYQMTPVKKES
jgi:hypothetical protein